jgi:hypothetical protein
MSVDFIEARATRTDRYLSDNTSCLLPGLELISKVWFSSKLQTQFSQICRLIIETTMDSVHVDILSHKAN